MKEQKDLLDLSRSPVVNQFHAITESITKKPPKYNMHGLVKQNVLQWLWKNLLHLGNTRYPYQVYRNTALNNGIFTMEEGPVSIALLSDWASDTPESHNIGEVCGKGERDFTIHLGDTYYVGNEKEIACNFNSTFGAPWPYGKRGSFALPGNHEMYSSGKSYFTQLLPYMSTSENGEVKQQEAAFFCLENKHWRIIGLDTGYNSLKGFLGVASNQNLSLHPKQIEWLKNVVKPEQDNRGIILLSHHQPFSAFDKEAFANPGRQLSPLLGNRTILWFWGHEHRLSLYGENKMDENRLDNVQKVFGRCIGHGGMPVDVDEMPGKKPLRNLVAFDKRLRKKIDGKFPVGFNGYAVLSLNGPELTVEYFDDNDLKDERKILEEKWRLSGDGRLEGVSITDSTEEWKESLTRVQDLQKAIQKPVEKTPVA